MSRKALPMIGKPSQKDLLFLCELITSGKLTPVIDKRYTLSEVPDALEYLEQGHARGKVIITMSSEQQAEGEPRKVNPKPQKS